MEHPPTRVLIVDDREQTRWGLKAYLDTFSDMDVVGEASGGSEAVRVARLTRPDVVVLDVRMPNGDGLEASVALRAENPRIGVVFLTLSHELADRAAALGYPALVKGHSLTTLVHWIRRARSENPGRQPTSPEGRSPDAGGGR